MSEDRKCERCGEWVPDMGICMEPYTKAEGMHPKCLFEAISENPELVAGRIPPQMIGKPELLEMLETISVNPEAGEPVDPRELGGNA